MYPRLPLLYDQRITCAFRPSVLQDADVPKEAKAAEATSSEPAPAPSETDPARDDQAAAVPPKEESTESAPPPVVCPTSKLRSQRPTNSTSPGTPQLIRRKPQASKSGQPANILVELFSPQLTLYHPFRISPVRHTTGYRIQLVFVEWKWPRTTQITSQCIFFRSLTLNLGPGSHR